VKRILLLPIILAALLSLSFRLAVEIREEYPVYLPQVFSGSSPAAASSSAPHSPAAAPHVLAERPAEMPAAEPTAHPSLPAAFVGTVINGQPEMLVGAYVPEKLALPVVQQPLGQDGYVSDQYGVITQFAAAAEYGTVGLLAHNYLSGQSFFDLTREDDVALVYGDGILRYYRVTAVLHYQALDPNNTYSDFIDLDDPAGGRLSSTDVFQQVYGQAGRVVFQTCIEAYDNASWGRLFVIAEPAN